MKGRQSSRPESSLDRVLGIVLLGGVGASLVLELVGLALYWKASGGLSISRDPAAFLSAEGFFVLLGGLFRHGGGSALGLVSAGIAVLILTPLARLAASLLFFAWKRDVKYLLLTLLVLVILSLSLAAH